MEEITLSIWYIYGWLFVEFVNIALFLHMTKTKDYHNPNTRFKYVNNYLQITWVHFVSGRKNSLTYFLLLCCLFWMWENRHHILYYSALNGVTDRCITTREILFFMLSKCEIWITQELDSPFKMKFVFLF